MRRLAWVVVLICACGKSETNEQRDQHGVIGPSRPPAGSSAPAATDAKPSAKGSVTLSGELAGTFEWKDDLAIETCTWVESPLVQAVELTLTDGGGTFISLKGMTADGNTTTRVTSAKLHADNYEQKSGGVKLSSTDNGHHITAQFDAIGTHGDKSVNIKGTLNLACGNMSTYQ